MGPLLGGRFCCENNLLVSKRKERGDLYGERDGAAVCGRPKSEGVIMEFKGLLSVG